MKLADLTSQRIEGIARMGNIPFIVPLYSQIIGNLWTGGCPVDEAPEEFQFIFSFYKPEYTIRLGQTLIYTVLYDSLDGVPDRSLLDWMASSINSARLKGPTLVHCQAGLNRSALVAGYALCRAGMSGNDAVKLIRARRSDACLCNPTFEKFLRELK